MKLVYASDLHGNSGLYMDLRVLVDAVDADLLVMGGDLFEPTHDIHDQYGFLHDFLHQYLCSYAVPVLVTPGNCDWPASIAQLMSLTPANILDLSFRHQHGGLIFQGYPYVNCSPFRNKSYEKRDLRSEFFSFLEGRQCYVTDSLGNKSVVCEDYFNGLPSMEEDLVDGLHADSIWVIHNPPYNSKLDLTAHAGNIGGKAIAKEIREKQPMLTLHGHVHESPAVSGTWIEKIGDTICVNPGLGNGLHAVIVEFNERLRIVRIEHSVYGARYL